MNVESSPVDENGSIRQDKKNLGKEISSCDTMSTEWLSREDLDRMIKLAESAVASCQRLIAIGDRATASAALTTTSLESPPPPYLRLRRQYCQKSSLTLRLRPPQLDTRATSRRSRSSGLKERPPSHPSALKGWDAALSEEEDRRKRRDPVAETTIKSRSQVHAGKLLIGPNPYDSGSNPSLASVNSPSSSGRLLFDFDCRRLCRCRRRPRKRRRHIRQPRARPPLQSLASVAVILIASSAAAEGTDAFSFVSPISPLVRASEVFAIGLPIYMITFQKPQPHRRPRSMRSRKVKARDDGRWKWPNQLLKEYKGKLAKVAGSNSPPRQFYVYALYGFVRAQVWFKVTGAMSIKKTKRSIDVLKVNWKYRKCGCGSPSPVIDSSSITSYMDASS
ncbi:unnamed protein product [Linum tenue]|uniref:Uncharacterized protein n=1 Tax=Linum tenue TaxID=586396 RepID=A0AAV0R6J6_9ROSI|nr:unnamed protein product [Linum tenue]